MACSSKFLGSPVILERWLAMMSFRFLRSRNAPHLAESIHIKWHIVHLALVVSHRAVGVAVKFCQTVDKIPYLPVAGMKNVGSVFVDMDTFHIFTVDVACLNGLFFDHQTFFTLFIR